MRVISRSTWRVSALNVPSRLMNRRAFPAALLATFVLVPAVAAAPGAVSGSRTDARGETSSFGDLVRASAKYRAGGALTAKISMASFAEAAASKAVIGAFFARRAGGRCQTAPGSPTTFALISFETDTKVAEAGFISTGGGRVKVVGAKGAVNGNKVTLKVSGSRFAKRRYNCAVIASLVATGPTTSKAIDRINLRLR